MNGQYLKIAASPAADNTKLYGAVETLERVIELHDKKRLLLLELRRALVHQIVNPKQGA
jgi:hypothetical protein